MVFSNLAKASEKQQRLHNAAIWNQLAETFDKGAGAEGDLAELAEALAEDMEAVYPRLNASAEAVGDRGMKRALKWGERVTKIQKMLIDRYTVKGEDLFEGKQLFICEACGFVFLGPAAPDPCPVCKAPVSRFSIVK
jgi:rubrerythrin